MADMAGGRPPKPESERLAEQFGVRFTKPEADLIREAAKQDGVSVAEWIRQRAIRSAKIRASQRQKG